MLHSGRRDRRRPPSPYLGVGDSQRTCGGWPLRPACPSWSHVPGPLQ